MQTVQNRIRSVEVDVRNGSSQRRYHGNTTGPQTREAAIGQAKAFGDHAAAVPLSQAAVANPASTASPASKSGGATRSSAKDTGPLKRNPRTKAPSEPIGIRP